MSNKNTIKSEAKLFNINEEAQKHYPKDRVIHSSSEHRIPSFNVIKHHNSDIKRKGDYSVTFKQAA